MSLISIAPMMDYTDRHARYFLRLIAKDILLYTEMITAHAIMRGDRHYLLNFHPAEHPVALQLGGADAKLLAESASIGEAFGYDEINLNVGCPSSRVCGARFGACLMLQPELVADCVAAMQQAIRIPLTVKCRIGVDNQDDYSCLHQFIDLIASTGVRTFIIHARKAWLKGLSPKQNREIPPLQYHLVTQIKKDFPELTIIMNGGIKTLDDIAIHLTSVDGVMIGRAAYHNPYLLAEIAAKYYPQHKQLSRFEIMQAFIPYINSQCRNQVKLTNITRHILGLFQGQNGAAKWRRMLSEQTHLGDITIIEDALKSVASL